MACAECERLSVEYERLEFAYAACALRYLKIVAAAEKANNDCEDARVKLVQHRLVHTSAS
jgi:hypothetical protein